MVTRSGTSSADSWVASHGGRGGPGEVVVQHLPERVGGQPDFRQGLIETGDRPAVPFLVHAVAAAHADDRGLRSVRAGVGGGPPRASIQYAASRSADCGPPGPPRHRSGAR